MKILQAPELQAGKRYWIYPKNLVVYKEDQHRTCQVYNVHSSLYLQLEGSEDGYSLENYDDCMFIEIPSLDLQVWKDFAELHQFPELLEARADAEEEDDDA